MLNSKERSVLETLREQEELCVEKYGLYAMQTADNDLRTLLSDIRVAEQQHLAILTQYLEVPSPWQNAPLPTGVVQTQNDRLLCRDMLAAEKYASHLYDFGIFDFTDTAVRQTLNRLQSDEQRHGEQLYRYLFTHGWSV